MVGSDDVSESFLQKLILKYSGKILFVNQKESEEMKRIHRKFPNTFDEVLVDVDCQCLKFYYKGFIIYGE